MQLLNKYRRVPLEEIVIAREDRQRRDLKIEALMPSIARLGVMNPIIVRDQTMELVAGERRLAASKALGLADIPVRFTSELSTVEHQIIELEENVARESLPWDDRCQAVLRIHKLYCSLDSSWTQSRTAEALGYSKGSISDYLQVGGALLSGNEKLARATNVIQARNVLARDQARRESNLLDELTEAITPVAPDDQPIESSILEDDFMIWARTYEGPKFNFIHCDFPFGIDMQDSDQGRSALYGEYDDRPETYWQLLEALALHQDKLILPSAHMMFWFSMKFYRETLDFFRERMSEWEVDGFPLIWVKSDNRGILPDPKRGPRRIYETCLFASRGDRFIVRSVSNSYVAPSGEKIHQSEKPEPVLRHFMQMFVDEHSRMLDPTCGSGSSLRAAESLGASAVLGVEKNKDFVQGARNSLKSFRTLRRLAQ